MDDFQRDWDVLDGARQNCRVLLGRQHGSVGDINVVKLGNGSKNFTTVSQTLPVPEFCILLSSFFVVVMTLLLAVATPCSPTVAATKIGFRWGRGG